MLVFGGAQEGDGGLFLHLGAGYHGGSACEKSPTCALPGICLHESFISIQIANTSLQRQMHVQVRACTHTLLPACVHPGHPRVSRTLAGMWTQMDTVIQRTLFLANNPS